MRDAPASPTPPPQPEPDAAGAGRADDPVRLAARRIRSVDAAGTEASDDTVDTDGKGLEAARDPSPWQDNVIFSNATAANHIPETDPDLAGVDSRPGHGGLLISTAPGHAVTYRGTVDVATRTGTRTALRFSIGEAAAVRPQPGKPTR
ncbi:DUF3005 domain-containing protein [Ralstonia syzygii subsp. celebesensis]|uniref:DUF3005 domain-containing protein n=2 Tax=Ralstonia solanacearum species complex TaxID=3116862 RepID=A0AAD0SDG8_RALSL|nr:MULTISPECIES: DUF3005 domain-containing protein [Ralstonia solanacearum species complex]CCA81740.1 conserved hypothethical protein [blood disease bacterium R229]AXV84698.1 DUF3005 domain-containing protein [Ralstonia solanacearum]AXW55822.1 DUF3005 domain-containing protein [Ralstonia solanacearum]QQV57082.1 DUF3005 domain-containing protein [Ralstonia syzygii subsp. celebesensis]CBJ34768.1 conserved hypothethical protein [Ralstonia solanacearum PSI07]